MNRSYSPSETSVAVVPSPSYSPLGRHPSPLFPEDLEPCKRICLSQFTSYPGYNFGSVPDTFSLSPGSASVSSPDPFNGDDLELFSAELLQNAMQSQQPQQQPQQQQQQPPLSMPSPPSAAASPKSPCEPRKEGYTLVTYQEPEQYYRARYETEGIRGPLKGQDNNHPSVQIIGQPTYAGTVTVELVHEDGTKHASCFLDETKDRKKALIKKIDPKNSNMIVEFEDLRIRRETKSRNVKEGGRRADKTKPGRNDKTACLKFTAKLQVTKDREVVLTKLSRPINLCAPPEGAELEWLLPEYGHASGDERVVIKGTKMTSPKVTFTVMLPDGNSIDLASHVDKEQSHQNILVIKTPRLPEGIPNFPGSPQYLEAKVKVTSGKAGTSSTPLPFFYIPNGMCLMCKQSLPPPPPQPQAPYWLHHSQCNPPNRGASFFSAVPQQPPRPSIHEITHGPLPMLYPQKMTPLTHPPVSSPSPAPKPLQDTHSPTLSPSSSPGPASEWKDITPTFPSPIPISQASDLDTTTHIELLSEFSTASMTAPLMPASPTYSAVQSPDNPIFQTYPYPDNPGALPYPPFTS